MQIKDSKKLFSRAQNIIPGGVNSPVRAFKSVNMNPLFIKGALGSKIFDADNNEYIDYLIGSGPMLLGHGHPEVMEAIFEQLPKGMTFFANNSKGIELAEEICKAVKCSEKVRFVSSGGEADMYAMRLARAYTGKDKILNPLPSYHINAGIVTFFAAMLTGNSLIQPERFSISSWWEDINESEAPIFHYLGVPLGGPSSLMLHYACLLYTSDAADE